ncbi:MAG: ribonuclease P protein component [Candidatus Saccharibacteria bacterium]|nr:ribonuclease P protein component [Candidatus Saccharibacteria bacterium]
MLEQKHRFHGHGSLRYVYAKGQAVRSSQMTVKYITNPRRASSRFSVVVSKKVFKSAVRRNRIRRRIYEIIRLELPRLKGHTDVAVMVFSPEIFSMPHAEVKRMVTHAFSTAGLYK